MRNMKSCWTMAATLVAALLGGVASDAKGMRCAQESAYFKGLVQPFAAASYSDCFNYGGISRIAVTGDESSNLDLYVYDPSGLLIWHDDGPSSNCEFEFEADPSGTYRIEVRNNGPHTSSYLLEID